MFYLESDYTEGAHPSILKALEATNFQSASGYGDDPFTASAVQKLRQACRDPEADVFLLTGGTQTNGTVISALLPPYAGVISADTGHISANEAGAVESGGHKVLPLPNTRGKLLPETLLAYLRDFYAGESKDHYVQPGMVYLSHPTEYGTLYTARELRELHAICREYRLPLYLDGARLGYALAAPGADVDLPLLAELCDCFYIGGTKVGALCGEAVVFPRHGAPAHFFTTMKQHGALLAKGRLLGVQFDALFTGGLYETLGRQGVQAAARLTRGLAAWGCDFFMETESNQIFPILTPRQLKTLRALAHFHVWQPLADGRTVVRLVTSWTTRQEDIDALLAALCS